MPELPEVERGRQIAERAVAGKRLTSVRVAHDPIVFDNVPAHQFRRSLEGRQVHAVRRWGKQLWFEMDASPHPLFHFGMTGSFRTRDDTPLQLKAGPKEAPAVWPPRFWKIIITADGGSALAMTDARRLGRILLRDQPEREPPLVRLGFDPLLNPPSTKEFATRLAQRRTPVKSLLLDQSFSAGVGNWIADEVLFQARLDPQRRADSLTLAEVSRLRAKLLSIIKRAVACGADDRRYPRTWLFHQRWGNNSDARTSKGHQIEHITLAGRTTAWVPDLQK